MLHLAVEAAFDDLLACWRAHWHRQQRRTTSVTDLAASRRRLDQARDRMHKLRLAVHPERAEIESVVQTVWCESLDVVVYLRWIDRHPTRPGNFNCACGDLVPVQWDTASLAR